MTNKKRAIIGIVGIVLFLVIILGGKYLDIDISVTSNEITSEVIDSSLVIVPDSLVTDSVKVDVVK